MQKIQPHQIPEMRFRETALVWDETAQKWRTAYFIGYKRQRTIQFVDAVLFNSAGKTYTSESFKCAPYSKMLLLVNLDVTLAPTDIYIDVRFSDNNHQFYKYMRGPFGDLRWEDGAGDKMECIDLPVLADYIQLHLVSSGCTAAATFLMNVKGIFSG